MDFLASSDIKKRYLETAKDFSTTIWRKKNKSKIVIGKFILDFL